MLEFAATVSCCQRSHSEAAAQDDEHEPTASISIINIQSKHKSHLYRSSPSLKPLVNAEKLIDHWQILYVDCTISRNCRTLTRHLQFCRTLQRSEEKGRSLVFSTVAEQKGDCRAQTGEHSVQKAGEIIGAAQEREDCQWDQTCLIIEASPGIIHQNKSLLRYIQVLVARTTAWRNHCVHFCLRQSTAESHTARRSQQKVIRLDRWAQARV